MENRKMMSEFIDVEMIQSIQDRCSKAMGLAFVTVDYKGVPVTKYSGFTPYCTLGRQVQGFAEMCEQCDAHGGLHAAITGQPYIYRCHADLVDFAVPLILNGSYMGAVLGGQVRLAEEEERELERILPQQTNWRKDKALDDAYHRAETVTYEKLESAVGVLRDMLLHVMEEQYKKVAEKELEEKDRELAEERAVRSNLEFAVQKQELSAIQQEEGFRYFFFVMNALAHLAYEEKAVQTGAVAYDYAEMMRYVTDSEHKISTLGEELTYIGCLLRIQKAWLRDLLTYSISVPERYWGTSCPFMVLQPLVENALSGAGEAENRRIDIFAEEERGDLLVQVLSNREWNGLEDMEARLCSPGTDDRITLNDADRSLKRLLGKRYGLSAGQRKDGGPGTALAFRLPLKREELPI